MGEARVSGITRLMTVSATLIVAIALIGCADKQESAKKTETLTKTTKATLVLDYLPNAVHTGIYRAVASGYYKDQKIDLKVIQPTSTASTLKAIDSGQADFGIADAIDIAGQIDSGRQAKVVMAIAQKPLGGLITLKASNINTPKELEGKTVGLTGVPSDKAVLNSIVTGDGGDPKKVKTVTIGFNGVTDLENKKIDAFTGFWPADGTQVNVDGYPTTIFKLDQFKGPSYPGLVVFTTQERLRSDPALIRSFLAATVKGYKETISQPGASLDDLLKENPPLKRNLAKAQLDAYLPLFKGQNDDVGTLDTAQLGDLSDFLVRYKLIDKPIPAGRFGTDEFLPDADRT